MHVLFATKYTEKVEFVKHDVHSFGELAHVLQIVELQGLHYLAVMLEKYPEGHVNGHLP